MKRGEGLDEGEGGRVEEEEDEVAIGGEKKRDGVGGEGGGKEEEDEEGPKAQVTVGTAEDVVVGTAEHLPEDDEDSYRYSQTFESD